VRTVSELGNFEWQRQTSKRVSIQFRFEDIRSNSLIISAR
jgi:hypothetical protein